MSPNLDLADPLAAFRLDGEVAVVTGGGSGIGRAVALALARVGAAIAVFDRDGRAGRDTAGEITGGGGTAEAHTVDVADESAVELAFAAVAGVRRRIDVLVNSAGIAMREPATQQSLAAWEQVMRVNVTGSFLCARIAARYMLAAGQGRIVNIASMMGFSGGLYPNASYQTSKGAVVNMTRALAIEWARQGIRVNGVAPTWIRTALTRSLLARPEVVAEIQQRTPMGKIGDPEDVVGAVLFLATRASGLVTGHTLAVDGGFLAQ